jgi:protease-4
MASRPLVIVLLGMTWAAEARAENNFVLRDVTRGLQVPSGYGVAGDFDVTAAASNPAGMATLGGLSLGLGVTGLDKHSVRGGGGWGAFAAFPLTLPIHAEGDPLRLVYGFGWQSLVAPSTWTGPANGYDATYFLNAIAVGSSRFSVGWTVAHVTWANTPEAQGTTTHHAGLSVRPGRFLSMGIVLRDIFEPTGRTAAEHFARSLDTELALRPLGDWRFEVAAGALVGSDDIIDWRARMLVRPIPGVTLFGVLELAERNFGAATAPLTRDARVLAGLSLDLRVGERQATTGASYGVMTSTKGSSGAYAGSSVLAQFSDERFPSFVEPSRFERLDLDGEIDERHHVQNLVRLDDISRRGEMKGVLMVIGDNSLAWGRSEEMREAILRLRRRGKLVIAYLKEANMRQFYLAAAADRVLLHPVAAVGLRGLAATQVYFKDLLDRIGLGVQVLQVGEYKEAGEIFTRTGPTKEAREELLAYLNDLHGRFVETVSRERKIPPEHLLALLARPGLTPKDALDERLVDAIAQEDEAEDVISKLLGHKVDIARGHGAAKRTTQWSSPQIAVIHVSGEIVESGAGGSLFGSEGGASAVAESIRAARESLRVRAIILRVNSPGGMVQPSEEIAREVERTRGKKPIIVSMGDVAASGGYWVSAPADEIFAPPSSLTGSIGVVGIRLDVSGMLAKLGVHLDSQKIDEHADSASFLRPWTPDEAVAAQAEMQYMYDEFVGRVASGRHSTKEQINAVARGRIWSGAQAAARGLVDRLEGLSAALDEAHKRAGLHDRTVVEVLELPRDEKSVVRRLLDGDPESSTRVPAALQKVIAAVPKVALYPRQTIARYPWAEAFLGL